MKIHLIVLILTLTTWKFAVSACNLTNITADFRLPTNVFPAHYKLQLKTFLPGYNWTADERSESFEGVVEIEVDIKEVTDRIVLHSDALVIDNQHITTSEPNVRIQRTELLPGSQFIVFHLNKNIEPQDGVFIRIEFRGKLRNDTKGFYLTTSPNSKEGLPDRVNAVTQFETTAARFMVPCFDEPEFKATWEVTLVYPAGAVGLTNTVEDSLTVSGNWVTTHHKRTPKMSSYLLAIFIGDVEFKEAITDRGTRIRVYAPPTLISQVDHALNVSRITLEGFEKLFNISFPMEKLDLVAVRKFGHAAMENWGLMVHIDRAVLYSDSLVSNVVVHELAHQWFGDLVTMKFWNELWLNEGLATFMESRGLSFLDHNFDADFYHTSKSQEEGLTYDSKYALDELVPGCDGNIAISGISYSKGSSLVRMIEAIMGKERFDNAIRWYLSVNRFKNTDENNFFDAFQKFTSPDQLGPDGEKLDIAAFAKCWTAQNEHPTIYAMRLGWNTIRLTHDAAHNMEDRTKGLCGYLWDVPIWYQQAGRKEVEFVWLSRAYHNIELHAEPPVVLNANSNGFYRIVYSDELISEIGDHLEKSTQNFSDSTKLRLLFDAIDIAKDGSGDMNGFAKISKVLVNDENSEVASKAGKLAMLTDPMVKKTTKRNGEDAAHLPDRPVHIVGDCYATEPSYDCFTRLSFFNKTIDVLCLHEQSRPGESQQRLLEYLKTETSPGMRKMIISLMRCSDRNFLQKVVSDEQYHLTAEEKATIERITSTRGAARRHLMALRRPH